MFYICGVPSVVPPSVTFMHVLWILVPVWLLFVCCFALLGLPLLCLPHWLHLQDYTPLISLLCIVRLCFSLSSVILPCLFPSVLSSGCCCPAIQFTGSFVIGILHSASSRWTSTPICPDRGLWNGRVMTDGKAEYIAHICTHSTAKCHLPERQISRRQELPMEQKCKVVTYASGSPQVLCKFAASFSVFKSGGGKEKNSK